MENTIKETIRSLWQEVLGVESIDDDANFFEVGGTSIKALKVIEKAKSQGISIPFAKIFTCQTINDISEVAFFSTKQLNDTQLLMRVIRKIDGFVPSDEYNQRLEDYHQRCKEPFKYTRIEDANNMFITGATGYIACHIVGQVLTKSQTKVYALVRGNSVESASERFWKMFNFYFPNRNYQDVYADRVQIVVGDLTKDYFGLTLDAYESLANTIDSILHTAGNINHYGVWEDFERINVNGTKRVIEFAKYGKKKRLNHISTMSVCHTHQRGEHPIPFTEFDDLEGETAENVYVRSKLMAERLVYAERDNLDLKIFRPSNIIQSYETGIFPYGITRDTLMKVNTELTILNILLKMQRFPDLDKPILDFSYVDETAKSIYTLMGIKEEGNCKYNVYNPNMMSITQFAERLHSNVLSVDSLEDYLVEHESELLDDIKQLSTLTLAELNVNQALLLSIVNDRTVNLLAELGFQWHTLEDKNIEDILKFN